MTEEKIDARGLKCPRPIIELAKLRRRAVEPTCVEVIADDLAFESDVRAWCSAGASDSQACSSSLGDNSSVVSF